MEEVKEKKISETRMKTFDVNLQVYACEGTEHKSEDIMNLIYDLLLQENLIINGSVKERDEYGY